MKTEQFIIPDIKNLEKFAENFLNIISLPAIVLLSGSLGAGKTAFVKAIGRALNIKETITSPSFNIMNSYDFLYDAQKSKLLHYDLYRLSEDDDVSDIDIFEAAEDKNFLAFIEWPQKAERLWENENIKVYSLSFEVDFSSHKEDENISELPRKITMKEIKN
ncbi:MAG: tRNA (adenosine(37)-N6)-threonylcarbamoyltransferase complex ATPase subunit type 1 TsaE [Spirochaetia bacterium]|nr:tRNA (adenosine(37)-N6)-threonylcarbamoyltransferase complex ATPase subunit type 1 TsaE [Spirochaetia bacterium]